MKKNSLINQSSKNHPQPNRSRVSNREQKGYALISSVLVISLLLLLSLAMLSLSSIETRSTAKSTHRKIAQTNARLALMQAIGQLQIYAGADRRVTANADILSENIDDTKKHYLTIWDTSEWDVRSPSGSSSADTPEGSSSADTPEESSFLATLVSGDQTPAKTPREDLVTEFEKSIPITDPEYVTLVGSGSVSETTDYVYAKKVEITSDSGSGNYAFWVSDEGVKARYDITSDEDSSAQSWAKAGRFGQAIGTGVHQMTDMENYSEYLTDDDSATTVEKMLDFNTLDLGTTPAESNKTHFHDITTSSVGLLVDNRWGGIRRDLSTAFELDLGDPIEKSPGTFSALEEFRLSEEQNDTNLYAGLAPADLTTNPLYYHNSPLGFLFEVPVSERLRYRGPTWDLLRNHYRIYKKERNALNFLGSPAPSSDAITAHGMVPFSYSANTIGSTWSGPNTSNLAYQSPVVSIHQNAKAHSTVQKIAPHVIRVILVYGLARDGSGEDAEYFLTIDPYFLLHNPYNQPLEFHSIALDMNFFDYMLKFTANYKDGSTGTNKNATFLVGQAGQSGMHSYRLKAATGEEGAGNGSWKLDPGEIKVANVSASHSNFSARKINVKLTSFEYNEGAGIYLGNMGKKLDIASGSEIKLQAQVTDRSYLPTMYTRMFYPQNVNGAPMNLQNGSYTTKNKNHDYENITLLQNMRLLSRSELILPDDVEERTVATNVSQIPILDDGSKYMFALDISMKDFTGDVAVMSDFNPRAIGVDPRDYNGQDVIAPNWEVKFAPSDLLNLQFVNADNNGFWGEGKTSATGGKSHVILYDLPRAPLSSLGALQHADTAMLGTQAMHSIANSRIQTAQEDPTAIFNQLTQSTKTKKTPSKYQIDSSWAANEALWDRYYFSGINWGDQPDQAYQTQDAATKALINGDIKKALVNSRMTLVKQPTLADLEDLKNYKKIGNYLGIRGAFNVNSTSVEAWKAVLASLSGRELSHLTDNTLTHVTLDAKLSPFSRFTTPGGSNTDDYTGFRALDETELQKLAEKIVDQVRLRGPFMGLSDFVNRRLVNDLGEDEDNTGKSGALQAAIDASLINTSLAATSNVNMPHSAPDVNAGMANYLTQGDILTPLGPIIATRSDTFTIRCYGESLDSSGNVQAKAWCEATVQRGTDWLAPNTEECTIKHPDYPSGNTLDEPILRQWDANPDLPLTCEQYGRRFNVISFRWLSSEEI